MSSVAAFYPAPQLSERLNAATAHAATTLQLTAVRNGHAMLLCARGDIDAANADIWESALDEVAAATDTPGLLLIDAREVDFMGSVAYAALATQSLRCRRRGIELRLISTQPIVARVISGCGLRDTIPMYSSVDAALDVRQHHRGEREHTRTRAR